MKRSLLLIATLALVCAVAFGSGQGEGEGDTPELVVQLMADSPPDKDLVTDAINERLAEVAGATVKFQNLTWTDWQQKYRLLITSGEQVDVLYAANWADYATYARDGAYVNLNDLVPEATPDLWEAIPQSDWDGVKVGGDIYAVPDLKQSYSGAFHLIYREDLRQKYDTPPIDDLASIEAFFDAIKENEPSMYPVQKGGDSSFINTLFQTMVAQELPASAYSTFMPQSSLIWMDFRNPRADIVPPWQLPGYEEYLQIVKRWADRGYWGEDILAEKNISQDLVEAGRSAAGGDGMNVDKVQKYIERMMVESPSWEIGELSWPLQAGFTIPSASQQDMSTIPRQSDYPEAGLRVIEAFLLDKDLQFLVHYGIEGTHYRITDDGKYEPIEGSNRFGLFGMNAWGWKNENILLQQQGGWGEEHYEYYQQYAEISVPNFGFAINRDPINAEITAISQIEEQYAYPLWSGLVDDIDAAQETLEEKLEEAGLQKVIDEYRRQFDVYLDEIGR